MNRKIIIAIVVGLIILLLIWWGMGLLKTSPTVNQPAPKPTSTQTTQAPSPAPAGSIQQVPAPVSEGRPRPAPESQGGKFSTLPNLSAAKIVFYGKVVDQDGKPLSEVKVIGKTGSKVAFYTEEHRDYQTVTDAEGLFVFDQFKGDGLVIDLNKLGYKFASEHRNFLYSAITGDQKRHEPDPKNPVVFTMFKSVGAEPMIYYATDFIRIPSDGSGVGVNLRSGKVVLEGGDLMVAVLWEGDLTKNDFSWSAKLVVSNGGIIAGGKDQLFIAPAEGYQPSLEYRFGTKDRGKTIPKEYYVFLGANKGYARIKLFLQPADTESTMSLAVWLNPSGSRNLEYDPTKKINK